MLERLGKAAREATASPEVQAKLGKLGVRVQGSTAAEMQALLERDTRLWGQVIRAAKIEPE